MPRWADRSLEKRLKKLKKDFQKNVQPSIKRHRYHLSRSERSRLKHSRAIKKLRRAEARNAGLKKRWRPMSF